MANNQKMKDCKYCDGLGEVFASHKVRYNTVSPPYENCPVCNGNGRVPDNYIEDEEEDEEDTSLEEHLQDEEDWHNECRYDEKEDIDRFGY